MSNEAANKKCTEKIMQKEDKFLQIFCKRRSWRRQQIILDEAEKVEEFLKL